MNKETINKILKFRDDRDWKKYHSGKDLSISISLEANELLEIFQWSNSDCNRLEKLEDIKDELADVLIYCAMLADYYNLDMDEIISNKLNKNLLKYPNGKMVDLKNK